MLVEVRVCNVPVLFLGPLATQLDDRRQIGVFGPSGSWKGAPAYESDSVLGQRLSARYAGICRGVEVAAATAADLAGDTDAAYGYRVFLRHYCVHLAGPDPSIALAAFPADARAARRALADDGIIAAIVERFDRSIGLWADDPEAR